MPQTPTGGEFYSPSRNLSCQVDSYAPGGSGAPSESGAYCESISGGFSLTLNPDGTLTQCTAGTVGGCLSNAGVDTPVLAYGTSYVVGPFTCLSKTSGMQCTIATGAGFLISASAVTPLGGAVTVPTTTTTTS